MLVFLHKMVFENEAVFLCVAMREHARESEATM